MKPSETEARTSDPSDLGVGSFRYDADGPLGMSLAMLGARTLALDEAGRIQGILFPAQPAGAESDLIGRRYLDDVVNRTGLERRQVGAGGVDEAEGNPTDLLERLRQVIADEGSVEIPPTLGDGNATGLSIRVGHRFDESGQVTGGLVVEIPVSTSAVDEVDAAASSYDGPRVAVLDALLSTVPYRIWWKDQRSQYLGCNKVFAENAGLDDPEDIVGKNDFDFPWAETGAEQMRADDQEVLADRLPKLEYRETVVQAESTIEVSASKVPLFDSGGDLIGVLGMFCDITDQVMTQRALADERARMAQIVETIPFAVAWKGRDHRYLGCNAQFAADAGLHSPDAIVGLLGSDLDQQRPTAISQERDEELMSSGRGLMHQRVVFTDEVGEHRQVEISRVPVRRADGEVTGLLVIMVDHTDRAKLESQLFDASKMEAIGQLASGVAHEINTPIQFVGDNIGFLKTTFDEVIPLLTKAEGLARLGKAGEQLDDAASDLLAAIEQADLDFMVGEIPGAIEQSLEGIDRVTRIVRGLKEFAHPGSDEPEPSDVNHAIESTVAIAANEWKYVADVEFDLARDLPLVSCMPAKLAQALLIIIVNAAQAIGEANEGSNARGRIDVSTTISGGICEIRIADDGPGMSEQVKARIFEPFFTTKEVGVGSGQGLPIAHRIIISDHGGRLDVVTAPGEGTTFVIRIPIESKQDS